jgi:hypothetical protein
MTSAPHAQVVSISSTNCMLAPPIPLRQNKTQTPERIDEGIVA